VCIDVFTLDAELLARCQCSEGPGPATSIQVFFLGFPVSLKQMLRWFPSSKLPLHASHVALPI